jgi:hypothetical protein
MPTHFLGGVSNVGPTNPLHQFGMLDPTKWQVYWDDFIHIPLATEYTITLVGTSTLTQLNEAGGQVRILTDVAENEGLWFATIFESFLLAQNKKTFIKTRFQVGDAIQSDMVFGLHSISTTPQAATTRFCFVSDDASADIYFNNDTNAIDSDSSAVAVLADDTFITLAAYYDGAGIITLYADDVKTASMGTRAAPIAVAGAEMAVGMGYINGASGAETTDIDYMFVAQER